MNGVTNSSNMNYTSNSLENYKLKKLSTQEVKELQEYMANKAIERQEKIERNEWFVNLTMQDFMLGNTTKLKLETNEAWRTFQANIDNLFAGYKDKEIWNAKGLSNTIDTPYGEMRVSLKIDNYYYDIENLSELSYLDTYKDGFISGDDYLADKLVLRGYDANGDEVEFNFLQVMGGFDLTELYNDKKYGLNDGKNHANKIQETLKQENMSLSTTAYNALLSIRGNSMYQAEISYKKQDSKNTIAFFETYADQNGWIDFNNKETANRIFSDQSLQLAYRKKGADGTYRLEKISIGSNFLFAENKFHSSLDLTFLSRGLPRELGGNIDRKAVFSALMDEVSKNPNSIEVAKAFTDFTGLAYTESNIQKVKDGLESGGEEFLNSLTDIESVTGMKLDKDNGTITLRFSSGRETTIALEDLYSDSGEFLVDANGQRAMPMNEAKEMTQEELNELDFSQVGIKDESGTIVSLKDLGITAIQKATYADGRFLSFILTNSEGMQWNAQDLYNISFLTSGGLDKNHQQENNQESNSAFSNHTDKDSDSLTNKIRQISNPLVFPNKPQVDMRV